MIFPGVRAKNIHGISMVFSWDYFTFIEAEIFMVFPWYIFMVFSWDYFPLINSWYFHGIPEFHGYFMDCGVMVYSWCFHYS